MGDRDRNALAKLRVKHQAIWLGLREPAPRARELSRKTINVNVKPSYACIPARICICSPHTYIHKKQWNYKRSKLLIVEWNGWWTNKYHFLVPGYWYYRMLYSLLQLTWSCIFRGIKMSLIWETIVLLLVY